jgi:putative ABC transport system permease protein
MISPHRTLLKLFRRRRLHADLEAELAHHRELTREHGNAAGLGNTTAVKESALDLWRFTLLENAWRDLLFAARGLRRNPAFTITAVLSLALGIGVSTAMFTVLNAVAIRPLPYSNPEQLVWITQVLKANSTDEITLTPDFLDWRIANRTFEGMAAYNYYTRSLTGVAEPVELHTAKASAALLPLLGVSPLFGRNFQRQEDFAGHEHVALLSHSTWRNRFGADKTIVGKAILLDGEQYTVVGVLPERFTFPGPEQVDAITPLGKNETAELSRNGSMLTLVHNVIGRLKPGITRDQAGGDLGAIQAHLPVPAFHPTITIKMLPLRDHLFGSAKIIGIVLVTGSLLFLLIASVNVASLSLVRLMQRDRELAIRRILGAARARVVSQLVMESSLLAALACGVGFVFAVCIRALLIVLGPYRTSIYGNLPFDMRVLAFAAALLIGTILVFGMLPALRMSDFHLGEAVAAGQTSIAGKRHTLRLLSVIAATEIAIVIALSSSAALMLKSFWNMRYKELGFASHHLIAATINVNGLRYRDKNRQFAFVDRLLQRTAAIPGVESVALTNASEIPPGEWHATNNVRIEGRPLAVDSRHKALTRQQEVNAGYFHLLHIPLLEGRFIQDSDRNGSPPVVVVGKQFAERYFAHESAIGHRLQTGEGPTENILYTIVGVVGDVKTSGLAAAPEPVVYTPYSQTNGGRLRELGIIVSSPLPVSAIAPEFRKTVQTIDSEQPIAGIATIDERLNASVSRPRFTADLLFAFSCMGILLAIVGVYGVITCRVRAQLREIAVRQALGAQPRDVISHVVWHGIRLIVPGVLAGVAVALAGNRLIANLLFQVKPNDFRTLAAVCACIVVAALGASCLPAVRVSRLDPLPSLRKE